MRRSTAAMFAAVAFFLLAGSSMAKDWTHIRVVTEGAYPPFNYLDDAGRPAGFDVDIARAVCAELDVTCDIDAAPWESLFDELIAGRFDIVVASVYITDERRRRVAFTDRYYRAPTWFAARKDAGIEISADGLGGRAIGVQDSTVFQDYVEAAYGDVATVKAYPTQAAVNDALRRGEVDVVLSGRPVLEDSLLNAAGGEAFALVGDAIDDPLLGEGAGIALRKEDADLRELLNQAIAALRANGVYDRINRKYFSYDIYDE